MESALLLLLGLSLITGVGDGKRPLLKTRQLRVWCWPAAGAYVLQVSGLIPGSQMEVRDWQAGFFSDPEV